MWLGDLVEVSGPPAVEEGALGVIESCTDDGFLVRIVDTEAMVVVSREQVAAIAKGRKRVAA